MSKVGTTDQPRVFWAAVCDCGWAASSRGTSAERVQIEGLGRTHARNCDDDGTVRLERRADETETVKDLKEDSQ